MNIFDRAKIAMKTILIVKCKTTTRLFIYENLLKKNKRPVKCS